MKKILYLGNNLNQATANVSVMATLGPLLEQEGYTLYYASSKQNKALRLLDMMLQVIRYATKVEVVLIDTYSTQNFYYALIISQCCRLWRLPYVPILHGGNLPQRLATHPKMSAMLLKNARCNVSPSNYLKSQFEKQGYTNLKYIPNTIQLENYSFLNRLDTIPKLLWVRSFSKIYNPSMAVKVLKELKNRGIEATLCMVGPDSDGSLQSVQALSKTLEVEVTFTGKLSKQEWIQRSKDYNVFINTTTIDNMPVSVIEAMALGLPVVSTNVGGMPYLIENGLTGLLVPSDAINAMSDAIASLFNGEAKRNDLVLNARAVAEGFDWERVKGAWRAVLGCVLCVFCCPF